MPPKDFDPVEAASLQPEAIDAAVAEALTMPMPDPDTATDRVFAEEESLLEDGAGPWSGFQS